MDSARLGRVAALGATFLAAACAPMVSKVDAPEVTVETVRLLRIVDSKAEITIDLKLFNPNSQELAISSLEYEITLDGRPAATGRTTRVDVLPPRGEGKVDLAGRVDVSAVATAMMALSSQLPVKYTIDGKVALRSGGWLPFSRKGEIPVSRFDRAGGSRPR